MKRSQPSKKQKPVSATPAVPSPGPLSQAWMFLEHLADSRGFFWCSACLVSLAVLAYYPSSFTLQGDYDVWFHLAYGRHYVQNLTWQIDHSMFSWTPANADWMYATWLGSSLLYMVHQAAGVPGLFILHSAVLLASAAVVAWLARSANIRIGLGLLTGLFLVAVVIRFGALLIKPEMFSILFITLTIAVYFRFRMDPKPWIIAAFPLLFLIWVNTHGLWIFGLAFLGIVFAVDLVLYIIRPNQAMDRRAMVYLAWSALVTALALCANPHGPYYPLTTAYEIVSGLLPGVFPADGAGNLHQLRDIVAYRSMWKHLFYDGSLFHTVPAVGMAAMFTVFLVVWVVSWKRTSHADFPVAAANIVLFFMAMTVGRLVLIYPLIWVLSMVFLAWRAGPETLFPRFRPLFLAVILLLIGHIGHSVAWYYESRSWFGHGYRNYIPDKEARFIMDNNLPQPLFNDYLSGGYLMWAMYPDYKVFIDPRHAPYREQAAPDFFAIGNQFPLTEQGLKDFTSRYPFRTALIHHREPRLIMWLSNSPDWRMVYFDTTAVVMVQKDIFHTLKPEARNGFHDPADYQNISDPKVLLYLFTAYSLRSTAAAAQILDFYAKNVSNLYVRKQSTLTVMNRILAKRMELEGRR